MDIDELIANTNLDELSDRIAEMTIVAPVANVPTVEVPQFEPRTNLLDPFAAEIFKSQFEPKYNADRSVMLVTPPVTTMATLDGQISNIHFNEANLINILECNEIIVALDCNFGHKIYEHYTKPVKERKSNRGRKKKEVVKKNRKKQGDGSCFNSQLTFTIRPPENPTAVYKFKLFRTGRLQLPNARPDTLAEIIKYTYHICTVLEHTLNNPPDLPIQLTNINPSMQNYKFILTMPSPAHIIDLGAFAAIIRDTPAEVPISDVKYSRVNDTLIVVKFDTPIARKREKKTSLKIYQSGKVNISGGLLIEHTTSIYEYISNLFVRHYETLCVVQLK